MNNYHCLFSAPWTSYCNKYFLEPIILLATSLRNRMAMDQINVADVVWTSMLNEFPILNTVIITVVSHIAIYSLDR